VRKYNDGNLKEEFPPIPYLKDEPLAPYTTFRIGGPAEFLLFPGNGEEFGQGVAWCQHRHLPLTVLGSGSNVLVSDKGVPGVILLTTGMRSLQISKNIMDVEAGMEVNDLCEASAEKGLSGLETFSGLPGTIGGAVFMNARCYDISISDIIQEITVVDSSGQIIKYKGEECNFSYKHSRFQTSNEWIVSVRLGLISGPSPSRIRNEMKKARRKREDMGQFLFPNVGCIFKNDHRLGTPSGKIIEQCGLKGCRIGGAKVFERHANFIVNMGDASAEDVLQLMRTVEAAVYAKTGIRLIREIQLLGQWANKSSSKSFP